MARLYHVKKARKDNPDHGIKKGDSYYWWQFAFRPKQYSLTMPRRSQYMTQSAYLGGAYDIEDNINDMAPGDIDQIDDIILQIEELRDQAQDSLDNIPEQLKEAPAGETLQNYIDAFDEWISDLEAIDVDIDEDEIRSQAEDEYNKALENCAPATLEDPAEEPEETAEEIYERLLEERQLEILEEIQSTSFNG